MEHILIIKLLKGVEKIVIRRVMGPPPILGRQRLRCCQDLHLRGVTSVKPRLDLDKPVQRELLESPLLMYFAAQGDL